MFKIIIMGFVQKYASSAVRDAIKVFGSEKIEKKKDVVINAVIERLSGISIIGSMFDDKNEKIFWHSVIESAVDLLIPKYLAKLEHHLQ